MPKLNIFNSTVRYLLFLSLFLFSFPVISINAQETTESEASTTAQPSTSSIFSIEGGKRLMDEADKAVDNQQYDLAAEKLQSARQVYNQLSNFYLQLFNSFTGLDNGAAESHRKKALETGIERDNATYQLALVHRAQDKPELSIPLLVQIVTSQSPGSGLGKKAYEQLLEIGFVDVPFTPPGKGDNPPVNLPPASNEPSNNPAPQTPPTDPNAPVTPIPQVPDSAPIPGDSQP
ncbi:hypothetical protein I4641_14935 [Waterburya agarophytonicola K14]|uniref:Uncharacterized protein n=1 Tax=Waterburya agarophytonicola KI4 TaxID=2874699 RepID=A0A964FI94_9CYAN|nr:hypothetical protein [Waterburya agarophytonicola]MCC0178274.1 hypothetical protein [Waterburya agarophytonicola KI4]